eukprot:1553668-Prymnesium_polylepis.1
MLERAWDWRGVDDDEHKLESELRGSCVAPGGWLRGSGCGSIKALPLRIGPGNARHVRLYLARIMENPRDSVSCLWRRRARASL